MDLSDVIADIASGKGATVRGGVAAAGGLVTVGGATIKPTRWINGPAAAGEAVVLLLGRGVSVAIGDGSGRRTLTSGDSGGNILTLKAGPVADNAYIAFYADSQAQSTRTGWIGFGARGSDDMYLSADRPGGRVILNGSSIVLGARLDTSSADIDVKGAGIAYSGSQAGGTGNRIGFRWGSPNINVSVDNVVSAVAATISTGRLKTRVRAVAGAVETVLRLRPVVYTPLELDGTVRADAGEHIGLIAEEVDDVVPSAVLRSDDGTVQSVNYMELTPLLIAAVQELAARVAALEEGGA